MWCYIYLGLIQFCKILQFTVNKITVFCSNIFQNIIYSCYAKAEFSELLLQSSVSHDPSEIILICCSRNISYFLKQLLNIFCNHDTILFRIHWIESSKEQHLKLVFFFFWCYKCFTLTSDKFTASLLNKTSNFFLKNRTYPKLLNNSVVA